MQWQWRCVTATSTHAEVGTFVLAAVIAGMDYGGCLWRDFLQGDQEFGDFVPGRIAFVCAGFAIQTRFGQRGLAPEQDFKLGIRKKKYLVFSFEFAEERNVSGITFHARINEESKIFAVPPMLRDHLLL